MQQWGMTLSSNVNLLFTYLGLHDFFRNGLAELHYLNTLRPPCLLGLPQNHNYIYQKSNSCVALFFL